MKNSYKILKYNCITVVVQAVVLLNDCLALAIDTA